MAYGAVVGLLIWGKYLSLPHALITSLTPLY